MKITQLFLLILFLLVSCKDSGVTGSGDIDNGVIRDISSMELVSEMGAGWNLGNTLDAVGENETVWGNPVTTKAMIDAIAERGFKTLRLPVTWKTHMGSAPDYIIDQDWLNRVQQVVDYGIDNEMYVIINIHHDDSWIIPTLVKSDQVRNQLDIVWTQIANHFKDYSDYLLFETLNEPRHEGTPEEWTGGTAEGRQVVNLYQQVSLDAIRATGGNNSKRHVLISTYAAAGYPHVLDDFILPDDDRLIMSLHNYNPWGMLTGDQPNWGSNNDRASIDSDMSSYNIRFISKGIPVVLTEWGSSDYNNLDDRLRHAEYFAGVCAQYGIVPVWWDVGVYENSSGLMDRRTLQWPFGNIADVIINAVK